MAGAPPTGEALLALVRAADPESYLAALFLPEAYRADVFALLAYHAELAAIRDRVREPLPGQIRLQWWAEVVQGLRPDEAAGHPVAAAVLAAAARHNLPGAALARMAEAHERTLFADPMPTLEALEGHFGATLSALLRLLTLILAGGDDPPSADAAGHGGVALGLVHILRSLPEDIHHGRLFVPADVLVRHGAEEADMRSGRATPEIRATLAELREHAVHHLERTRESLGEVPQVWHGALLPLVLVPGELASLARSEPFRPAPQPALWRRQLRLWRAARRLSAGRPFV